MLQPSARRMRERVSLRPGRNIGHGCRTQSEFIGAAPVTAVEAETMGSQPLFFYTGGAAF